jgi:hypothetical protein
MPVFDADSGASDGRAARVPGAPDGQPGRQGRSSGVGLAVAALVVLTAGVALGGIMETGVPSGSQTPSHAVATPPACVPVATNVVPGFTIAVVGADPGYAGLAGYSRLPSGETLGHAWRVPAFDPGRDPPPIGAGAELEIRTSGGACIRHLVADAAPATLGHVPDQSERIVLRGGPEDPPTAAPPLGSLPAGDWVVRVVAQFETGVSGPGGLVIGERFFRIRVGPGPYPTPTVPPTPEPEPTPRVTPAALCGPVPTDASLLEVQLSAPGVAGIAGTHEFGEPPDVSIGLGDTAELTIVGAACATSWTIATLTGNGETYDSEDFENPEQNPDYAAQNRWRVRVPVGEHRLVATLRFGPDLEVSREWRVIGLDFTVPETFLVGANGSRVLALPGCGLTLELANGYSAGDSCGAIGYPAGLEVLHVPAWSAVVLEIPGWTIIGWNGSCGHVVTDVSGPEHFEWVCSLGGFQGGSGALPPGPARFLARPGEFVVQAYVTATRDGDQFSVPMFALVAGE